MVAGSILFHRVYIPNTLGPTLKQKFNSYEEKEDKTKERDGHQGGEVLRCSTCYQLTSS